MKKFITAVSLLLLLCLVGCGKTEQTLSKTDTDVSTQTSYADTAEKVTQKSKTKEKKIISETKKPAQPEQTCSECGRSVKNVSTTKSGYCDDCYKKNQEDKYGYCEKCGKELTDAMHNLYSVKRCANCSNCDYCGGSISEAWDYTQSYICRSCFDEQGYCAICKKKTTSGNYNAENGICRNCYEKNPHHCNTCSSAISFDETLQGFDNIDMCESCYSANYFVCSSCGRVFSSSEAEYAPLCRNCGFENYSAEEKSYCSVCGADCTFRGLTDGKCDDCLYSGPPEDYETEPNVWCPNCGYGFFTTGVGTDGFTCGACGHNWLP